MAQSLNPCYMVAAPGTKHYFENAPGNLNACEATTKTVIDAIECIKLNEKETFVICDYGAADGGVTIQVIREVIDFIKKKFGCTKEIHVIYEDLPSNNFNSLFEINNSDRSYLGEYSNVYVTACGTSFYQQCLPSESVHLGISYTAMMWLSKKPCDLSGGIVFNDGTDHTAAEKALFARQAAKDWETNLLCRSSELKPGGSLVIAILCVDNNGHVTGMRPGIKENLFKVMSVLWTNMMDEGIITKQEFLNTTLNQYFMTTEEIEAPFNDSNSAVRKAKLNLVDITTKISECPFLKTWEEAGNKEGTSKDPQVHAKQFVGAIVKWSRSTMLCGLSDERTEKAKNGILDEFYTRYETEVANNPENHCYDFVHAFIHIAKGF